MPDPPPQEPHHHERLWPSAGVWVVLVGLGVSLGLVAMPLVTPSVLLAVVVAAVLAMVVAAVGTSPVVAVADGRFSAGRARLPVGVVGEVEVLDADAMRRARGTGLDARSYLCLRGWVSGGVLVHLEDPDDPTPSWVVSSRRPAALAAALRQARQAAHSEQTS